MSKIKVGDTVVLTGAVPESTVYPWVKAGTEGVVTAIHPEKDYPYSVQFSGEFVVDPHGCPTISRNPTLLFELAEIELKNPWKPLGTVTEEGLK